MCISSHQFCIPDNMKRLICLQLLGIFSTCIRNGLAGSIFSTKIYPTFADSTIELTENFLENLHENLKDTNADEATYQFIDRQVSNYINLIKSTRDSGNEESRKRRDISDSVNISRDIHDVYELEKLTPLDIIDVKFPQDIMLFKHDLNDVEKWYAVCLEQQGDGFLGIYKYNGSRFTKIITEPINTGIKLGLHTSNNGTYIVAAENSPVNDNFHKKSTVYLFTKMEKLNKVQKFDVDYASDVSIWEDKGQMYMGISKEMSNTTGRAEYQTQSVIYKWLGRHFDIIQYIDTSEAMKIIPFVIGKFHFLAVTNRQNNLGISNVYSEIFKYDLVQEKFISYQKILTDGASDMKVFCFKKNEQHEYFLAVANTFSKDRNQNIIYKTNSIIYKFVDDYFIPFQSFNLNGLTEWLPVNGLNGEFALFAACKFEGLKIFQYDGWKFQETETQFTDDSFGKGIVAMNSYQFQGNPVVVVANANDKGNMVNFYRVDFKKENEFNEYYDGMLSWCRKSLLDARNSKQQELSRLVNNTPTAEAKELQFSKMVTFKNLTVRSLRTSEIENVKRRPRVANDENLSQIESQLNIEKLNLDVLELNIQQLLYPSAVKVFNETVTAKSVVFNDDNSFQAIIAQTINGIDSQKFLENVISTNNNGVIVPKLELEHAKFESNPSIKSINGHDVISLLHKYDAVKLKDLIINGNAIFDNLNVKGLLNGVNFTTSNILLTDGDQTLLGDLKVKQINAKNIDASHLNKLGLGSPPTVETTKKIRNLGNLNSKHLIVGGYLNNIDLPTLDKYALKIKGDQEITSSYEFDKIKVEHFNVNAIDGVRVPEDLLRIDSGMYDIEQDVQFMQTLEANNLVVTKKLNQIRVKNGKLDVLLGNITGPQEISGYKIFQNVDLLKPVSLQGKFNTTDPKWIYPVTNIDEELSLVGDYFLNANTSIEGLVSVHDLTTGNGDYSIRKLRKEGLRVHDESIMVHLNFTQQLNVGEIFADKINGIDPQVWVVNDGNEKQYITGSKTFDGDLHITGDTNVFTVNGIDVRSMERNTLKKEGDQVIEGKLHVQQINTDSLQGTHIKFGSHDWTETLTNDNELTFTGYTILKSLSTQAINCTNLNISGTINGLDFQSLIDDTVFLNSTKIISGHKHFVNLTVDNLTSRKSFNLRKIPSMIKKAEVTFNYNGAFNIPEDLNIEKIYFRNRINHLNATEFSANWLDGPESQQIVNGDQFFDELVLHGENTVASNRINGFNLTELDVNTVKTDEPHAFNRVTFEGDFISLQSIGLHGHIEGIDIDTILADSGSSLILTDTINFLNDVYVKGNVHTQGLINKVNFTALCEFAEPKLNEAPKNLHINGNAYFLKGPNVRMVNGLDLGELLENSWLSNRESNINGNLYFNKVEFEDQVDVKGLIGDIKVEWLKSNYFSKTKNQTISAKLDFSEGITFGANLAAPRAKVGRVFGINLEEFVRTAVLDDFDQVFEQSLFAEAVKFNDLQGSFTVNGLNLENDVMRYDIGNMVTGVKTVRSVKADSLRMDRNYKVQGVDLLDWIRKSVLRSGNQKIDGRTTIRGSTTFVKGVSLSGLLNKNQFDPANILLKSIPQTISVKKVFVKTTPNMSVFKAIKLKGYLNYIDVAELVHNQALKNQNNTFTSQVNFNTDLAAGSVVFEGLFQGVNVSQLLYNLTNYVTLNNYYNNYETLLQLSQKVRDSLKVQAHYLNYYKTIQYFNNVNAVFPVKFSFNEDMNLATVKTINNSQVITFLKWNPTTHLFSNNADMLEIKDEHYITRIAPLNFDSETYLYVEHISEGGSGNTRVGQFLSIVSSTSVEIIATVPNNGTRAILPCEIPVMEKVCVVMLYHFENYMDLYCDEDGDLRLYQKLDIPQALTVIVTYIDNSAYIMAINEGSKDNEASVIIWKSDENTGLFNVHQRICIANPKSITTIEYNGVHYLAIGSGQILNTLHPGQISIRRFHENTRAFMEWQEISLSAPIQITLTILPTNELMMYLLTENPAEPLVVYKYEGLSKFVRNTAALSLEICSWMAIFNDYDKHFLVTKIGDRFEIIEAVFKG